MSKHVVNFEETPMMCWEVIFFCVCVNNSIISVRVVNIVTLLPPMLFCLMKHPLIYKVTILRVIPCPFLSFPLYKNPWASCVKSAWKHERVSTVTSHVCQFSLHSLHLQWCELYLLCSLIFSLCCWEADVIKNQFTNHSLLLHASAIMAFIMFNESTPRLFRSLWS